MVQQTFSVLLVLNAGNWYRHMVNFLNPHCRRA